MYYFQSPFAISLIIFVVVIILHSLYSSFSRSSSMKKLATQMGLEYAHFLGERGNRDYNFIFGIYKKRRIKIYDHKLAFYDEPHVTETIILFEDSTGDKEIYSYGKLKKWRFLGGGYLAFLKTSEIRRIIDEYIENGNVNYTKLFLSKVLKLFILYLLAFFVAYLLMQIYFKIL